MNSVDFSCLKKKKMHEKRNKVGNVLKQVSD